MSTCPSLYTKELSFVSDADDRSVLLVQVYQKHHVGKNELVGSFSNTIGEVLGTMKDGGMKTLNMTSSTDAISPIKVLEATLGKNTPGGSDRSEFGIKFALAAKPLGDVDANKLQMIDATTMATQGVSLSGLDSTPAVVDRLSEAVDTGNKVAKEAQAFDTTWNVLLKRMELFNKIVADIAQVSVANCLHRSPLNARQIHPYTSLAWSVVSSATQVCPLFDILAIVNHWRRFIQVLVDQKNRDERIIGLLGTMSDVFTFVEDAEPLEKIKTHMKTITLLIQQVTECGYFITEYTKQKDFCQSLPGSL